jgi:hypothetical protein
MREEWIRKGSVKGPILTGIKAKPSKPNILAALERSRFRRRGAASSGKS